MVFSAEPHNSLHIKGVILEATISSLLVEDIANLAEVLEKLATVMRKKTSEEIMTESDKCQIETVNKYIDVMHQGLTADRLVDPPLWVQYREQLRQDVFLNRDFSLESQESQPSWWFAYKSFVDFWWPGTKLFLTNRGQPGVCKWEVQQGETLFVPLGCLAPIAIRPAGNEENTFRVVGPVYLDGAMDGEAFLGQLPDHWCVQFDILKESASDKLFYKNLDTGAVVKTDPRMDKIPLPYEWEPVTWAREDIDPMICCRFRNKLTGELINYDPRMTSEALEKRGVNIQEIVLI
ncbi:hypothetical protein Daus18300_011987 [Diaporthe australafricana]|uniref:Uncharacterized protein n=1 Tax=Diaporthe australafricana TaxID=127596 RepID=A0ABR3W4K3_9PEZI